MIVPLQKYFEDAELARLRDEDEFMCLACSFKDTLYDSWDVKDAEFIHVYKTMFKDLRVRLPFMKFECGVLV